MGEKLWQVDTEGRMVGCRVDLVGEIDTAGARVGVRLTDGLTEGATVGAVDFVGFLVGALVKELACLA